jgi:hypothetical protein
MKKIILRENVLSDNLLLISDNGKVFRGGYIAIILEYGYQNSWTDKLINEVKFKSEKTLYNYLYKHYPEFELCY